MKFLDCIDVNPKISLEKSKIVPFIEMGNVSTIYRNPVAVERKPFDSGVKFQDGDTVVARITPCLQNGKRFYCKNIGTGFGSTEYLVFRPKNESVDNLYLYYFMKTKFIKQSMINSMVGATGRQRVNNDVFKNIEINFPNKEKQIKIGKILSAYDDLIENNQKQIKLLEEAAQRLYKEWFVDLCFPGYETTPIIDGVPEGWDIGFMCDIAVFQRGKTITQAQVIDGDIPVVAGGIEPAYYHNKANTVAPVITVSASGANAGFTKLYNVDVFASDCSFVDRRAMEYLYFVYGFLKNHKDVVKSLQKGSAQPHVYAKDINNIMVIIPDKQILASYCNCVKLYFEKIKILQEQIKKLAEARDRLLPKLMSGELEV